MCRYPLGTKLLIVHADDLGETHSVNAAAIKALQGGTINSASLMVPCPWFPEIADYAKSHSDADFGLHLTLTSERIYYRWGPVAPADKVPSLLDQNGYFRHDWEEGEHIDPKEVEIELRAQIERALAMGIRPTHLDSHQYRLIMNGNELFDAMLRVAHEYKLPGFVTSDWFADHPYLQASLGPSDIVLDSYGERESDCWRKISITLKNPSMSENAWLRQLNSAEPKSMSVAPR